MITYGTYGAFIIIGLIAIFILAIATAWASR